MHHDRKPISLPYSRIPRKREPELVAFWTFILGCFLAVMLLGVIFFLGMRQLA